MTSETRSGTPLAGAALGLIAIVFGFSLGGAFGAAEDAIKARLQASAAAAHGVYLAKAAAEADPEAAALAEGKKVLEKSWVYLQRAHLHAGALGTVALAVSLLLGRLTVAWGLKQLASVCLGVGAVLYPLFWMLAAFRAPRLGSTGAAKDSLSWLAIPGSGLCLIGAVLTLLLVLRELRGRSTGAA
jgi:hypothetical protein